MSDAGRHYEIFPRLSTPFRAFSGSGEARGDRSAESKHAVIGVRKQYTRWLETAGSAPAVRLFIERCRYLSAVVLLVE